MTLLGLELARDLDSLPNKTFADRLILLTALDAAEDAGFAALLEETKTLSAGDPERAAGLITWFTMRQSARRRDRLERRARTGHRWAKSWCRSRSLGRVRVRPRLERTGATREFRELGHVRFSPQRASRSRSAGTRE